jgi:hypothetical protein
MWNYFAGNIIAALIKAMEAISPTLREALIKMVKELDKVAAGTPNRWDDIFVGLLKTVLGISDE